MPNGSVLYYEDPQIRVASSAVVTDDERIPLADIEFAWRVRRRSWGRRAIVAAGLLILIVLAEVSIGVAGRRSMAVQEMASAAPVLALRFAARLAGTAVAVRLLDDLRRYRRHLELWACVSHAPVLLFRTDDALRYGQVCRALVRALNARDEPLKTVLGRRECSPTCEPPTLAGRSPDRRRPTHATDSGERPCRSCF